MNRQTGRLRDRTDEGRRAAFAVGAGDMDHRRQAAFRIAELFEQCCEPSKAQIDQNRIAGLQAVENRIGRAHQSAAVGSLTDSGSAGGSISSGSGARRSNPRIRAIVADSLPRGTTMSTIP